MEKPNVYKSSLSNGLNNITAGVKTIISRGALGGRAIKPQN